MNAQQMGDTLKAERVAVALETKWTSSHQTETRSVTERLTQGKPEFCQLLAPLPNKGSFKMAILAKV